MAIHLYHPAVGFAGRQDHPALPGMQFTNGAATVPTLTADQASALRAAGYTVVDDSRPPAPGSEPLFTAVASLPTASSSYRGLTAMVQGNGTTTADTVYVCLLSATGSYSWKSVAAG